MTARAAVALGLALSLAACGENTVPDDVLYPAVGGTRLMLQRYRFDDGTEQTVGTEFFDRELHVRCAPQAWPDGETRCVPITGDAIYTDAQCQALIGRMRGNGTPQVFLAYESDKDGLVPRPARVFRAGVAAQLVPRYYEMRDGRCTGPFDDPDRASYNYFAVGDELGGDALPPIRDADTGGGRLGLLLRSSDDGARVPLGIYDRELAAPCRSAFDEDGGVRCAPAGAVAALYHRDAECTEPLALSPTIQPRPAFAAVTQPSGCTDYRAVLAEEPGVRVYLLDRGVCVPIGTPEGSRRLVLGPPIDLAPLGRTVEDVAGRRLQRIVLEAEGQHFLDEHLYDTATRADCRRQGINDVTRCIPAEVAATRTVFSAGCGAELRIAELPPRTCRRLAFAAATASEAFDVRAIGDRPADPLFFNDNVGQCLPYASPPGLAPRLLGPAIDPAAWVGAIYYGAR